VNCPTTATLLAEVQIGDEQPSQLVWNPYPVTISRISYADLGGVRDTRKDFIGGETATVPLWFACRFGPSTFPEVMDAITGKGRAEEFQVLFNTVGPRRLLKAEEFERGYVIFAIKFIPIDSKPRRYLLNLKPWDQLCLKDLSS
jgi:hypothetical protein